MSTHPLDRELRDRLYNGSAEVPAGTWEAIQGQLKPGPSGSGFAWQKAGIALLALVAIALAAFLLWPQSNENPSITPSVAMAPIEVDFETSKEETQTDNALVSSVNESDISSVEEKRTITLHSETHIAEAPTSLSPVATKSNSTGTASSDIKNVDQSSDAISTMPSNPMVQGDPEPLESVASPTLEARTSIMLANIDRDYAGINSSLLKGDPLTDCYNFGSSGGGTWIAEVYFGPTFSLRSLESRPDENVDDYIAARDSTETSQISLHAGARFGYEFANGVTAKVGLHYTMVNEVFRLESRTVRTVTDSLFDNNGNFIRVDTTTEIGTRTEQQQNRYHSIDIPLLVGYRIDNGNWDFGIQAGPVLNLVYNANGKMIGSNGESISFSDQSDPTYTEVFKDRVGVSLFAGLYASKRVGNKLWVFAEPHLHHRFSSVTLDDYAIDQRQTNIGLSFGLRVKL